MRRVLSAASLFTYMNKQCEIGVMKWPNTPNEEARVSEMAGHWVKNLPSAQSKGALPFHPKLKWGDMSGWLFQAPT